MPTLEEVLLEVELTLSRRFEGPDNAQVMKVHGQKPRCFGGKHNPLAPHAESECFQLHPEKRDSYHSQMKHKDDKKDSQSDSPQVFSVFSKGLEEGHTVLDSGASFSLFKTSRRFVTYHPTNIPLYLTDGSCVYAVGMGTAAILSKTRRVLHLENSLVVPSISSSLIALKPFLKKACRLVGRETGADLIEKEGNLFFKGEFINNTVTVTLARPGVDKVVFWYPLTIHRSLGHPSNKYASKLFPLVDFSGLQCKTCVQAKIH
ncbi:hypothetical protein O181_055830 [Austropuccinia psidii MF-1]|uniref:Retrovirus-related Pol polyprotein from transposon TNT 1-94-like beta-barrel domain-containing protein n=1 Tax=Austropuccinia psidii MF-1 TaxID=1389203 RepID=A0A9Q3HVL4_9BASI|nr:hypothetical protein [Austropuccinia psidii MF-1]